MSINNFSNYDGLYGDLTGKYSAEYIFLELIATRSQKFNWNIKTHLHPNLYQVFFIQKGLLTFHQAQTETEIKAPCVIFIPPTMLHGLVYKPVVEGQILTVSEKILEDIFKTSSGFWNTCNKIQIIDKFDSETTFKDIVKTTSLIDIELFGDRQERFVMLKTYLTQLFIQVHRLSNSDDSGSGNSLAANYFRKFQQGIKSSENSKSIPEYAGELNITPVHLNRICKSISGKSAIEIVHQNIISDAQKYLIHTSYSISEIAYKLNFEYPNYFSKLFRKCVGLSPKEYRDNVSARASTS
jgi:AraC family transcriptional activator of pobA